MGAITSELTQFVDFVRFLVRGNNDHVIPIRDLAVPSQRDNAFAATNHFPVGETEDHQMPTAHRDINCDFDSLPVCEDHHNSHDLFNRDFVVSPALAEFSVCVDSPLVASPDVCTNNSTIGLCNPNHFVLLHEEVAATGLPNYRVLIKCRQPAKKPATSNFEPPTF